MGMATGEGIKPSPRPPIILCANVTLVLPDDLAKTTGRDPSLRPGSRDGRSTRPHHRHAKRADSALRKNGCASVLSSLPIKMIKIIYMSIKKFRPFENFLFTHSVFWYNYSRGRYIEGGRQTSSCGLPSPDPIPCCNARISRETVKPFCGESVMSDSEMSIGGQNMFGLAFNHGDSQRAGLALANARKLEHFIAAALGSRGGPNKVSNKSKRSPMSYLLRNAIPREYLMATGLRSRGGPNKVTNKLRSRLSSYLYD